MDLARHGTRPPPRPGTRGLSPCLPGRSAREGLGLPPAGTGGQRSRNSTPDARTVDQALQIPCPTFRKTASGPSTHWLQSRMPTSSDSRSSCARGRFILPARAGAARRSAGAKKSTPCFGRWLDQSVRVPQTRSPADAPKRFDLLNPGTLPPRKEHADTSESPFRLGTSNRIRTGWLGCLVGHPRAVVRRAVWRTVRQP